MNRQWVTNIRESEYDPNVVAELNPEKAWMIGKFVGEPKATESLTVEELQEQGYIGIYEWVAR